ncbi:hypothetical protein OKW42_007253 [Paraburkholderia sp. WC7.3d]
MFNKVIFDSRFDIRAQTQTFLASLSLHRFTGRLRWRR